MLLAADIGNTEIVLGIFRGSQLEHTWRLSTQPERTPDELALAFSGFLALRGISFETQVTGLVAASCPMSPPPFGTWHPACSPSLRSSWDRVSRPASRC